MLRKILLKIARLLLPQTKLGDLAYAGLLFIACHGRLPRRNSPKWSDRLFAFKVSGALEDPLRVFVSDKEHVKLYIKAVAGESYNVPTLMILRSLEDALEVDYPVGCIIKPTHMSGELMAKESQAAQVDKKVLERWFKTSYYGRSRERNYKSLAPKVIVEPLLFGGLVRKDYRIFCFNGQPRLFHVSDNDPKHFSRSFYDLAWNKHPFNMRRPLSDSRAWDMGPLEKKPAKLKEMLRLAAALSRQFSGLLRVDFYSNGRELKVGELTNCPGGAKNSFFPEGAEERMAEICL